jgi:hypothetical protein
MGKNAGFEELGSFQTTDFDSPSVDLPSSNDLGSKSLRHLMLEPPTVTEII